MRRFILKSPRKSISSAADAAFSIWRENSLIHCTLELVEPIRIGFVFFKLIKFRQYVFRLQSQWLFWVQLVTNSDSQISEVIVLNLSFTMFSIKINVRALILKEFLFLYV